MFTCPQCGGKTDVLGGPCAICRAERQARDEVVRSLQVGVQLAGLLLLFVPVVLMLIGTAWFWSLAGLVAILALLGWTQRGTTLQDGLVRLNRPIGAAHRLDGLHDALGSSTMQHSLFACLPPLAATVGGQVLLTAWHPSALPMIVFTAALSLFNASAALESDPSDGPATAPRWSRLAQRGALVVLWASSAVAAGYLIWHTVVGLGHQPYADLGWSPD